MARWMSLILLLLLGCGYGAGGGDGGYHWGSVYRPGIKTVAVPTFGTRDYHRGVEFQLSEALIKKIEEFTPYKVVPRERADTVLEGEVVAVRTTTLNLDPHTATPQEMQYEVTVDFTWKDLRSGKILVSRDNFSNTTTYYPTLGEGEFVGSENSVERLAGDIVTQMESDW